jgi:beta-galactosidase
VTSPITFDDNAYRIHGQPTWLLSGEMHYFKMTRGDWRRRLVQLKCAGFNTVSVYMPWNYHELAEGDWRFDGDRDVAHFLELAAELGLYVVARPGPYICDEWQSGGLPAWLSAKRGIRLRANDPQYLRAVDQWWDRIAPIIRDFQLDAGGTIILAQVENEYGHYGEAQEPAYVYHLRDGLRARGITVPIVNCDSFINFPRLKPGVYDGINLCCNFGGDALRNLARARGLQPNAPLFVTEYWIAAFDWWGRNGSATYDSTRAVNGALEIAAGGAGGLTAFVFAGGAHFGYWHGRSICSDANFMTTRYGPGAPILDDGRFDAKYQLFKNRVSPLCTAELAQAGMPEMADVASGVVKVTRKSPTAEFTFYQNRSAEQLRIADLVKDQACVDMSIPAGTVQWTVTGLSIAEGFRLESANLHLFRATPALILFGDANAPFTVTLTAPTDDVTAPAESPFAVAVANRQLTITGLVPETNAPAHLALIAGERTLDVLILNQTGIENCWTAELPGAAPLVFGGPSRVEDLVVEDGALQLTISSPERAPLWTLRAHTLVTTLPTYRDTAPDGQIALDALRVSTTFPEIAPAYDDAAWASAPTPLPMAHFGHGHGFAWYRTTLTVETAGPQMIHFSGSDDRAHVYVDGHYLGVRGLGSSKGWHLMPSLTVGEHTLALLVENLGMFNSGAEYDIPLGEPKGIYGPVWHNSEEVTGWRMRAGLGIDEAIDTWEMPGPDDFSPLTEEVVKGPAWLSATFTLPADVDGAVRLELGKDAGKGSVWLNGKNVGRYWSLGPQQSLWLPLSWLQPVNELVIFEESQMSPGNLRVSISSFGPQAMVSGSAAILAAPCSDAR